jgi:hypothetical protein
MAINASFFSSKELAVGVAVDLSTVGAGATAFTAIESDSVSPPTFNDIKIDRRGGSGSGIMTATTDMFHYGAGASIEGSVSGFLTDELFNILMPNSLGQIEATDVWSVDGTSKDNANFEHGATSALEKTLSFAYNGVGGTGFDDCIVIPGCVITSLTITGDPNEDGGRMKFDASWTSRTPVTIGAGYSTTAFSGAGTHSVNYCFLGDYSDHVYIGGASFPVLLKSFSLSIENPVVFAGFGGSAVNGAPQTYVRSVPEMSITANPVVKYDVNVDNLWENVRGSAEGVQAETLASPAFEMADNATYTSGSRAIRITDGTVTEMAWDEGDYLGVSVSIKARGDDAVSFYVKHA